MEQRIKYGGVRLRARIVDVIGRYLITIGGIGIIAAVLGILIFILREAYPLFESAYVEDSQFFPKTDTQLVGSDPHGEVAPPNRALQHRYCSILLDRHIPNRMVYR